MIHTIISAMEAVTTPKHQSGVWFSRENQLDRNVPGLPFVPCRRTFRVCLHTRGPITGGKMAGQCCLHANQVSVPWRHSLRFSWAIATEVRGHQRNNSALRCQSVGCGGGDNPDFLGRCNSITLSSKIVHHT